MWNFWSQQQLFFSSFFSISPPRHRPVPPAGVRWGQSHQKKILPPEREFSFQFNDFQRGRGFQVSKIRRLKRRGPHLAHTGFFFSLSPLFSSLLLLPTPLLLLALSLSFAAAAAVSPTSPGGHVELVGLVWRSPLVSLAVRCCCSNWPCSCQKCASSLCSTASVPFSCWDNQTLQG